MTALDIAHFRQWVGRSRETVDVITPRLAQSLAAILDDASEQKAGMVAPQGIQWCLSPDIAPMSGIGPDGHPARGGFMPPVPLPRRMWAGGALEFSGDFIVGDEIRRVSRIESVDLKEGRTGTLCFVAVSHEYSGSAGLLLTERQDVVYRDISPTRLAPAPETVTVGEVTAQFQADPVILARYSAVTFNGHRIHYDRDYCRDEELYPGLVVHGPLQATFLLRMAGQMLDRHTPRSFAFRGTSPLFDGQAVQLNGNRVADGLELWAADARGAVTMQATATA